MLLVAVLHLLTDKERPGQVVAALRDAVPAGSYLAVSHLSNARRPVEAAQPSRGSWGCRSFRSEAEAAGYLTGLELVDPGLVDLPSWRPESAVDVVEDPERSLGLAGVGRKP